MPKKKIYFIYNDKYQIGLELLQNTDFTKYNELFRC